MKRRHLWLFLVLVILAALVAGIIFVRKHSAPHAARLLPDGEAIAYVNLRVIRQFTSFGQKNIQASDRDYQDFVDQTGIQFERDLEFFAVSVQPQTTAKGSERRYAEVFVGHFDSQKLAAYLKKQSAGVETFDNKDVYTIPHEGRPVRVVILSVDEVAVSNTDSAEPIHHIIERSHAAASPFSGGELLRAHYHNVPLSSFAWAIARLGNTPDRTVDLPGGITLPVPADSVGVASLRYTGAAQLQAEVFTRSDDDARNFVERLNTFLSVFREIETNTQPAGADPDVKAFFASIKAVAEHNRAVITAALTQGFIMKVFTEPPPPPPVEEKPAVKGKKKPARKK